MSSSLYYVDSAGTARFSGINPPRGLTGIPSTLLVGANGTIVLAPYQVIPLSPVVSQRLSVSLNGQNCIIEVYAKRVWVPVNQGIPTDPPAYEVTEPFFLNLRLNEELIVGGVMCLDRNLLVRGVGAPFVGDLAFVDSVGNGDPEVVGLGTRWLLTYWPEL